MQTFDFSECIVTIDGVVLTGHGEGDVITIERGSPLYTKKVGASGSVARSRSSDRSGTIKLKVMATAAINDVLSAIIATDERERTGLTLSFLLQDLGGTTTAAAPEAYLTAWPALNRGAEVGEVEWVLEAPVIVLNHGSNE